MAHGRLRPQADSQSSRLSLDQPMTDLKPARIGFLERSRCGVAITQPGDHARNPCQSGSGYGDPLGLERTRGSLIEVGTDHRLAATRLAIPASDVSSPNKKPPRMTSGETANRFSLRGYAGSSQLGESFDAAEPMTLGPTGFEGESIRHQPIVGWKKTGTPCDREPVSRSSRSGRFLRGDREVLHHPEHLFVQPEVGCDAFGSLLTPTTLQTSGRVPWHTLASLAELPSVLCPEGLRFLGVLLGCFAH